MNVLITDYTVRKVVSANDQGIVAVTVRAHCQCQVAYLSVGIARKSLLLSVGILIVNKIASCNGN